MLDHEKEEADTGNSCVQDAKCEASNLPEQFLKLFWSGSSRDEKLNDTSIAKCIQTWKFQQLVIALWSWRQGAEWNIQF